MSAHASSPGISRQHCVPGQYAPVSGLYRVHHETPHRADHDVVVLRAEEFPACRLSRGHVQYLIKKVAVYITDDFDFAAPVVLIFPPKRPAAHADF